MPLLGELLLDPCQILARRLEVALEVIELCFAFVEGEPAQPNLFLGARQPVLRSLLRIFLDAVGQLDGSPDELERFEPCRAVVGGEAC